MPSGIPSTPYRFWAQVDAAAPDVCWEWLGYVKPEGYGRLRYQKRDYLAHRLAYHLAIGDPGGLHVCHHCDNPLCCNPSHLFLGTDADNCRDRDLKGRASGGSPAGSNHPNCRLSPRVVHFIRTDPRSARTLSKELKLTVRTILKVRKRITYFDI